MMTELLNLVHHYGNLFFGSLWPVVWIMIRIGADSGYRHFPDSR